MIVDQCLPEGKSEVGEGEGEGRGRGEGREREGEREGEDLGSCKCLDYQ